ncbi:MAG TPA: hypothetical protein DEP45_13315 [Armatimonadetes bacterium]|nr:hypothetical protein [Armatimonadota bacterium]
MPDPASRAQHRGKRRERNHRMLLAIATLLMVDVATAQPIEAPLYRIRAADTLDIVVSGHPEWSLTVTVRPDGRITYPATGEIEVAGITIQELTDRITAAVGPEGRHLRNPRVLINVTGMQFPTAYVLGAVQRPGAISLPRGVNTAPIVLTMAGGAAPQGDLSEAVLYRDDGSMTAVDLRRELAGQTESTLVFAGDLLVVPETNVRSVGVLGAVGRTGEVPLPPREESVDLLSLLVQVGGASPAAESDRAVILRQSGEIEPVALDDVVMREADAPLLYGGDVLYVPPKPPEPEPEFFAVAGAVTSPGRFEYREGTTLADALALAGQTVAAADPERVMVIRADGEKQIVNVLPMLAGEAPDTALMPLEPDDIILIPSRNKSYVILGAVASPGFQPWDENSRLADALAKAGGPRENAADMQRVMLVRRTEPGADPTVLEIDARKLLQGQNEAANWRLQPGDTIYIPQKGRGSDWRQAIDLPLWILGVLGTVERIF